MKAGRVARPFGQPKVRLANFFFLAKKCQHINLLLLLPRRKVHLDRLKALGSSHHVSPYDRQVIN
jgi:hypothetical protein